MLGTTDGAQTWTTNTVANNINASYNSIYFHGKARGWMVGQCGTIMHTEDLGTTWQQQNNTVTPGGGNSIYFIDPLRGWAVGDHHIEHTKDGGQTWVHGAASAVYNSVYFTDTAYGWIGSESGVIRTIDGGQTWLNTSLSADIKIVKFANHNLGVAVGTYGDVFHTIDGGQTWTTVSGFTSLWIQAITFTDSLKWFASDNYSQILSSVDGAATFSFLSTISGSNIVFTDSLHGWVSGNSIYKTTDGGQTWAAISALGGTPACMSFCDTLHGIATGANTVYQTNDGGQTWAQLSTPISSAINSIYYPDTNTVWLTGGCSYIVKGTAAVDTNDLYAPFLDIRDTLNVCVSSTPVIHIVNYNSYQQPYDTLKATLSNGGNIIPLAINADGSIMINTPLSNGVYTITVTVSNPVYPSGLQSVTVLNTIPATTPALAIQPKWTNPVCQHSSIQAGPTGSGWGDGYEYELHKYYNNTGTDQVISVDEPIVTVNDVTDTFYLYYKLYTGTNICTNTPFVYSDTIPVYPVPPLHQVSLMMTPATDSVCPGAEKIVSVSAAYQQQLGNLSYCEFHTVTASQGDQLVTNYLTEYSCSIPIIEDSTLIYAIISNFNAVCADPVVYSDTLTMYLKAVDSTVPHLTYNKADSSQCTGERDTISVHFPTPSIITHYEFHTIDGIGTNSIVYLGANNFLVTDILTRPVQIYCVMTYSDTQHCYAMPELISDSLNINVYGVPLKPVITKVNNILSTPVVTGAVYTWLFNNAPISGSDSNVYIAQQNGNYRIILTEHGCPSPLSDAVSLDNVGVKDLSNYDGVKIYPNPTTGTLHIACDAAHGVITLKDMFGKKLIQKVMDNKTDEIDISSYANGIYYLSVELNGAIYAYPVTKLGN